MSIYKIKEDQLPQPVGTSSQSTSSASLVFRRDLSAVPTINGFVKLSFPKPAGDNFSLNTPKFLTPAVSTLAPFIKTTSGDFKWDETTLIIPNTASYLYSIVYDVNTVTALLNGTLLTALADDNINPYDTVDNVGFLFSTITTTTPIPTILNCIIKHKAGDRVNIVIYAAPVPTISNIPDYNIKISSLQFSCVQI